MAELTGRALASRVPTLLDQPLKVLGRRDPVAVRPGTSPSDCLAAVQASGAGDSVFVTDADDRLLGVLAERDIFGRMLGGPVDLSAPVNSLRTADPRTLQVDQSVAAAMDPMESGRHRNVPVLDGEHHLVAVIRPLDILDPGGRVVPAGAAQSSPTLGPALGGA